MANDEDLTKVSKILGLPEEKITVAVLKDAVKERNQSIPQNATKAELIEILEKSDKVTPTPKTVTGVHIVPKGKESEDPALREVGVVIEGSEGEGKRLFQLFPHKKAWMTKAEAKKAGHYWAD